MKRETIDNMILSEAYNAVSEGGLRGHAAVGQRMPSNAAASNSPQYREFQSLMYRFIDAIHGKGDSTVDNSLNAIRDIAQELMSKHGVEDRWLVHHMKKANLGGHQVMQAIITPDGAGEPSQVQEGETPMLWTLVSVSGMHSEFTTIVKEYGAMTDEQAQEVADGLIEGHAPAEWEDFSDTGLNPHETDLPGAVGSFHITPDGVELVKHREEQSHGPDRDSRIDGVGLSDSPRQRSRREMGRGQTPSRFGPTGDDARDYD